MRSPPRSRGSFLDPKANIKAEEDMKYMRLLPCQVFRVDGPGCWSVVERRKGEFFFDAADWHVAATRKFGGWGKHRRKLYQEDYAEECSPIPTSPGQDYKVDGKEVVSWEATLRRWRKFDDDTTMRGLVALMKKYGVEKPLWITEFGGHPAAHERSQGLGILRQAAILVAEGAKGLHYYEFYDYPHEPSRYQLVRHEDKYRTLGLVAYSQAIRYLTGASYEPDRCEVHSPGDSAADNLPYRVFGRGDETIICLWSNAATPAEVEIRTKEKCGAVHVATFCPQDAFLTETSLSPGGSTADGTTRIISDHRLTTVLYPLEFRILSLE